MTPTRKYAAVLVAALAIAAAAAFYCKAQPQTQSQTQTAPTMNRNLVVLDAAHGGADGGILLGDHVYEKDVTLEMEERLRATLTVAGFTVVSTRDSDSFDPLTNDQRAEIANRAHAVACIVLHATTSGSGVHLYTSALQPPEEESTANYWPTSQRTFVPTPWDSAQSMFVSQSLQMTGDLSAALSAAHLPSLVGHEPIRPLDSLTCPAVAVELAPLPVAGSDAAMPVTNPTYQQRVAETLAAVLMTWRDHAVPATATAETPKDSSMQTTAPSAQAQVAAQARKATTAPEPAGQTATRYQPSVGIRTAGQGSGQAAVQSPRQANGRVTTGNHPASATSANNPLPNNGKTNSPSRTSTPNSSTNPGTHATTGAHQKTPAEIE